MKTRYIKKTNVAALACASLLGSAATSQAAVVIGDIISINLAIPGSTPTPSGAAVIGQAGGTWNQVVSPSSVWESSAAGIYSGLVTTTGAASGNSGCGFLDREPVISRSLSKSPDPTQLIQ